VTRTRFGDYSVVANWSGSPYTSDEGDIAPGGFLAETDDGSVEAGAFSGSFAGAPLAPGTHYLAVERSASSVTVHQPLGDETDLAIDLPATWRPGVPLTFTATTPGAAPVPAVGEVDGRRFVFHCLGPAAGGPAPTYVLGVGSQ
jgi:hypothetical protein